MTLLEFHKVFMPQTTSVIQRLKEADDDTMFVEVLACDLRKVVLGLEEIEKVVESRLPFAADQVSNFQSLFDEEDLRDAEDEA